MSTSPEADSRPPFAGAIPLADFSEVGGMFGRWQGRMEQVSCGRFEGVLHIVVGRFVRLIRIAANQRVTFCGYDASRMFMAFPVTQANSGSMWYGHRFSPGHLVFQSGDSEAEHLSARRTDNQGAFVREEALAEAARTLVTDSVVLPKNWNAISPPPDRFARIIQQMSLLLSRGIADLSLLGIGEGTQLEQECVRSVVAALFPSADPQPDIPLPARSRVFRRAEEFMRAHLRDPFGAIDLCRELGVSDRTLRLAFRERVGLGPMVYFKHLRLNAVRYQLQAAPAAAIAEVAREFGFHHGGNFASDYHRLFGELPSCTSRGDCGGKPYHDNGPDSG